MSKHDVRFMPAGRTVTAENGILISNAAKEAGVNIELPCGGKGKCGRCMVTVSDRKGQPSRVLACQTQISTDVDVTIPDKEGAVVASSDHRSLKVKKVTPLVRSDGDNYGLALDIGTTTIAASVLDMNNGLDLYSAAGENRQRLRGEDVLTRMQYAEDGGTEELRELVLGSINDLIDICLDRRCSPDSIRAVYVSGNTTMIHLFLGVDPSPMRTEPYEPVLKEAEITGKESGLAVNPTARVVCMPSVSAYVGGDITSDIVASEMDSADELALLIDVGTNGEVALGNKDMMIVCSSSAGPAFEGGGVTSGMLARIGAIDSFRIDDGKMVFTTILSGRPKGICGSGLIDLVAELFRNGWTDKRGSFTDKAPTETGADGIFLRIVGDIIVTQDDLRTMMLTKAAIYAAAESLAKNVGADIRGISRIYIAGGFGSFIDLENAISIGLFPDVPRENYAYLGNASLGGAKYALISASFRARVAKVFKRMTYLDLSSDPMFFEEYMSAQFLPHTDAARFPSAKKAGRN